MKEKIYKIIFILAVCFGFYLSIDLDAFAQTQSDGSYLVESKHFKIYYYPGVDINIISDKIQLGFYDGILAGGSNLSNTINPEDEVAYKFDLIFQKVERILDMYPRKINLKVKIYKTQRQLDNAYYQVFGQPNTPKRLSYYIHKYSTIYTTQESIRQGVFAHEIGHAVSDHYFLILPPEGVSELMAQYVEMHLED